MNVPPPQAFVCPSCSAPLDPPDARGFAHCRYCRTTVEPRVSAPVRPPIPPQQPVIVGQLLGANGGAPRGASPAKVVSTVTWIIVLTTLAAPAGILGIVVSQVGRATNALVGSTSSLPVTCTMNQHLTVDGATYAGKDVAITAQDNCQLTIVNSNIQGSTVVRASGANVTLDVRNSTLQATGDALQLGDNGQLTADGTTHILSSANAISATGDNVSVTLDHTKVQGSLAGITLGDNAKINLTGAEVKGSIGLRGGENSNVQMSDQAQAIGTTGGVVLLLNSRLSLQSATVQASGTALELGMESGLDGTNCKITGGAASMSLHGELAHDSLVGCAVTGPHLVDGHATDALTGKPAAAGFHVVPTPHAPVPPQLHAPAPAPAYPPGRGRRF